MPSRKTKNALVSNGPKLMPSVEKKFSIFSGVSVENAGTLTREFSKWTMLTEGVAPNEEKWVTTATDS